MNLFFMDAHMHFDLYRNKSQVLRYIEDAKSYTIAVTNLPDIYRHYVDLDQDYQFTKIAIGYHPELVKDFPDQIELFKSLLVHTRYVGEIGLDGSLNDNRIMSKQEEIFDKVLEACSGKEKVLSVHSRRATKQVLKHLAGFEGKVILHWFSGRIQDLEEAIDRGYFFSINPQMLKSNSGKNIIAHIPVDRILLESDAPFIPGMENDYSIEFNNDIFSYISNLYDIDEKQVMMRVKANFVEAIKKKD